MASLLNPIIPGEPRRGDAPAWAHLYAEATDEREKVKSRYDEAISFALPGRRGFDLNADQGNVYDDTAVTAVPEFASNIQQGIMPNFSRWASHMVGSLIEDPEDRKEVMEALHIVDGYIFDLINSSNAHTEIHESLIDLAVGTGLLRVDRGTSLHPLNTRSVAQRSFRFTIGPDGQPDAIFEDRHLTRSQLEVDYEGISFPPGGDDQQPGDRPRKYRVVEAWRKDWTEILAGKMKMAVLFPEANWHVGLEEDHEGPGCSPYIGPFRWSKGSGEAWGRGPLFNILPSLRTVNFAMSALLEHSDFALAGIWNVEDDGVVNVDTIRLEPGAVVPKAPGSRGLENVMPGGRFDIQQFMIEEMRKSIKRALYADQLGDPDRSPKTATEVTQRMASLSRAIGSSFGRLVLELVMPFVQRVVYLLKEDGLIEMPTVDGQEIQLLPTSPLAQAQKFEDIDAFDRFSGLVQARFGPESVGMHIDDQFAIPWLAERFGLPMQALRSKEDQENTAATVAEGAMAMQGMGEPPVAETGIPGTGATDLGF